MARRVTVVGDATLDARVLPLLQVRPRGDVPASITLGPGGQGANVAVRLARRGVTTRLVCRIGDDAAGAVVRTAITDDGVELVDLGAPFTGTVVVLLDATGERTMLSQRVSILEDGPPPRSVFDTEWLLVSGYVLLEQGPGFSASGPAPRRVVAGCSLAPAAADGWTRAARSLQPHLAVVNLDEARVLGTDAGAGEPPALSRHLGEVLGAVVVVTEPSGATAILDGEVVHTRSLATPSIDTTGAGDAFTAGLVAELLEDDRWPPTPDRLSVAMAAAGSLASAVAAVPGAQARVAGEAGRA